MRSDGAPLRTWNLWWQYCIPGWNGDYERALRIRIIHSPSVLSIDGIRLDRFVNGRTYAVGTSLGCVFLAEGWAVPAEANDPPGGGVLLRHMDRRDLPPNLIIDLSPPSREWLTDAADRQRRPTRPV
jgi:hypothetical protein